VTTHTLNRLTRREGAALVVAVTGGKALPPAVLEQIVAKTDGVPLFVEELTKTVLESNFLVDQEDHYALAGALPPLAIPATLQDTLLARLDRLASVKEVAQLGAVLGREFAYELLAAVSLLCEEALQDALDQLVHAGLLFRRGTPPEASYRFKHALVQDAAYASLLKSTRQQLHTRTATVLKGQFPALADAEPEVLAHHYTEAGRNEEAIPYWHRAGQRALERSANLEAISHLRRGLEVLTPLPESQERAQQELGLQMTLGLALTAARGYAAPEVDIAYSRAYALGQHLAEAPQLPPVLWGRWFFAMGRAEYGRAAALGEYILHLGQRVQDPLLLLTGHTATGTTLLFQGAVVQARPHLEQSIALYDPPQHRVLASLYGMDYGMVGRAWLGWQRLVQGYPNQGLRHSEEALRLAQEVAHPYNLASILLDVIVAQLWRRESQRTQQQAEVVIALANEHGFALRVAQGAFLRSWALVMQGKIDGGLPQMRQALAAIRATGTVGACSWLLGLFAEACGQAGQLEEGFHALEEAQAHIAKTGEHIWEAELHRLTGELRCQHTAGHEAAEPCFRQALTVARGQEAKWLELRAAISLSRFWQQQGKRAEAYDLLAPIYGWFTEGFDTADLQEAKTLLEELT
jgi:predicted ATPase